MATAPLADGGELIGETAFHLLAFALDLFHSRQVLTKSPRNFRAYAVMEACNILIVPGVVLLFAPPHDIVEMLATGLAIGACAGFLLVGALYWAALDQRLKKRDQSRLTKVLVLADRLEVPLLLLTGAAVVALTAAYLSVGWSWPVIGAAVLTALAALEYVNYYHWQLQHFDHWADLKRLLTKDRFRRSHMARHLAAYRDDKQTLRARNG